MFGRNAVVHVETYFDSFRLQTTRVCALNYKRKFDRLDKPCNKNSILEIKIESTSTVNKFHHMESPCLPF